MRGKRVGCVFQRRALQTVGVGCHLSPTPLDTRGLIGHKSSASSFFLLYKKDECFPKPPLFLMKWLSPNLAGHLSCPQSDHYFFSASLQAFNIFTAASSMFFCARLSLIFHVCVVPPANYWTQWQILPCSPSMFRNTRDSCNLHGRTLQHQHKLMIVTSVVPPVVMITKDRWCHVISPVF